LENHELFVLYGFGRHFCREQNLSRNPSHKYHHPHDFVSHPPIPHVNQKNPSWKTKVRMTTLFGAQKSSHFHLISFIAEMSFVFGWLAVVLKATIMLLCDVM